MNTKIFIVLFGLLLIGLFVGCADELTVEPPEPQIPELSVVLGASQTEQVVPYRTTTIPFVSGGLQPYSYELYQDGDLVSTQPIYTANIEKIGQTELILLVTDSQQQEAQASLSLNGLEAEPDAPVDAWLQTAKFAGIVPDQFPVFGGASGGQPPYIYELRLDGELVAETYNYPVDIITVGEHVIELTVIDSEGEQDLAQVIVRGLDPEPATPIQAWMMTTVFRGEVPFETVIIAGAVGGQAPYSYELRLDGELVAETNNYPVDITTVGEHVIELTVIDSEGEQDTVALQVTGFEPEPEDPEEFRVFAWASPFKDQVPFVTCLYAHIQGGTPPYTVYWRNLEGELIGGGNPVSRYITEIRDYFFEAYVTDSDGQTATYPVVVSGTIIRNY